jgi:hypothetical protein
MRADAQLLRAAKDLACVLGAQHPHTQLAYAQLLSSFQVRTPFSCCQYSAFLL